MSILKIAKDTYNYLSQRRIKKSYEDRLRTIEKENPVVFQSINDSAQRILSRGRDLKDLNNAQVARLVVLGMINVYDLFRGQTEANELAEQWDGIKVPSKKK